ncbi:hypothetical protein VULLAG_LOCUS10062 [Vulpes lagopus]
MPEPKGCKRTKLERTSGHRLNGGEGSLPALAALTSALCENGCTGRRTNYFQNPGGDGPWAGSMQFDFLARNLEGALRVFASS